MAKKSKKKSNTVSANFKDVKAFKVPTDGNYRLKVVEAELTESSNDNPMINLTCEVVDGPFEGSKVWDRLVFSEGSLFRVRAALEAMGIEVPDGKMDIDPSDLVDLEFDAELTREVYEGKKKAVVTEYLSNGEADDSDDDEEEEEDKPKKGKKSSKKDDDEEEAEEIDVSEMDEDELTEVIEEHGLDVDLEDYSSINKKRKAVQEAMSSSDSDDDEEEEESEGYTEEQISEMSVEDLEELVSDLELEVDLEDLSKKKAQKAVLKALKKAKLLNDE